MRAAQLILASLLCVALSIANVEGTARYMKQTEYGTYKFGYDTGDQFRQEHRGFDGIVHGRYGYSDANGKQRYVEYTAGPFGYKVKGDYGADQINSKSYKAPSDKELTDLEGGLAEIKRQQLFGVPVSPYVKGYVHNSTPPPQPRGGVKGHVRVPVAPPKIEQQVIEQVILTPPKQIIVPPVQQEIFRQPVVHEGYVKGYVPAAKVEQHVILTPPKQVIVSPPKQVIQQEIFRQPVVHEGYVKGYVPAAKVEQQIIVTPPKQVIQQEIFRQPVVHDGYVKGYVPTPKVEQQVIVTPPKQVFVAPPRQVIVTPPKQVIVTPVQQEIFREPVVHDGYVKGYVPASKVEQQVIVTPPKQVILTPPKQVIQQEIFRQPVVHDGYVKGYVPAPKVEQHVIVTPPKQVFVTPPKQVVVQQEVFRQPVVHDGYVKGYVPAPKVEQHVIITPPKQVVVNQIHKEIFRQPVVHDGYVKGYVPAPAPKVQQQIIVTPPKQIVHQGYVKGHVPARVEQVVVSPPKRIIVSPPQQQIFREPVVHDGYVKGYVPPITPAKVVIVPPTQPPTKTYVKGYVPPHAQGFRVIPAKPVVALRPVVQHPVKTYIKGTPPTEVVKVVSHDQIFRQPVVHDGYVKGYVGTPAPVIKVVRPTPRVVVVSRPKGYQRPVTKGQVRIHPERVVVVKQSLQSVKGYVPPRQQVTVVTSRPKVFERPVSQYVKGYAHPGDINPNRRAQPCVKCRGQSQSGTFPQSVAREYVFTKPVQPYAKGYVGSPPPRTKTQQRLTKSQSYRRVDSSAGNYQSRGDSGVVWVPAPANRYRDNSESYDPPPPSYAYAPY